MWSAIKSGVAAAIAGCVLVSASGGCAGVQEKGQVMGSAISGDQHDIIDAPPAQVVAASKLAITELNLIPITTKTEPPATQPAVPTVILISRTNNDDKVTITVRQQGERSSRVTVNTGFLGDSGLRQHVLDKIRSHVSPSPATAPVR